MTASGVAADEGGLTAPVSAHLPLAFRRLAETAAEVAVETLSHKVDGLIRGLEEYTEGPSGRAALEGFKAYLLGKNPVWMALKGA